MSTIERLAIQGIRSFSPDEEQVIRFQKPITIICGPNGTGKSTIIECLKYATTGILPPGCKNGQAFIFDTDLANTSEVKATIKLLFRNRTKNYALVQRHFKLTQKKSKKEFKALDGAIKMRDQRGNEVSQSTRCSDLDRLIPELLGVSPAILDNVIFCHQEENNWPLKESSELKKKFDDIFESTRYTKALVELRRVRKEVADKAKIVESDVKVLATHLERANRLRTELEDVNLHLDESNERTANLETQLSMHTGKVTELRGKLNQFEGTFERIREMSGRIAERQRLLDRQKEEHVLTEFEQSQPIENIRKTHNDFNEKYQATNEELDVLAENERRLENDHKRISAEIQSLNTERAGLLSRLEEAVRQQKRHDALVAEARGKHPKFIKSEKPTAGEVREAMIDLVKEKREQLNQAETAHRAKYEQDSKAVEQARGEISALRHQKQMLLSDHSKLEKSLADINTRLSRLGEDLEASESRLREARVRARDQEKRVEEIKASMSSSDKHASMAKSKERIEQLDEQKPRLEARVKDLEQQQEGLMRIRTKRTEVCGKVRTVKGKLDSMHANMYTLLESADVEESVRTKAKELYGQILELCAKFEAGWRQLQDDQNEEHSSKRARIGDSAMLSSAVTLDSQPNPSQDAQQEIIPFSRITSAVDEFNVQVRAVLETRKRAVQDTTNKVGDIVTRVSVVQGALEEKKKEIARLIETRSKLEESLPKAEYFEPIREAKLRLGDDAESESAARRMLEDELRTARENYDQHVFGKKMWLAMIKNSLKDKAAPCPVCNQSLSHITHTPAQGFDYEVSDDYLIKFEAGKKYHGDEAYRARLAERMHGEKFTKNQNELELKLRACEKRVEDFMKHMPTASRLRDVESALIQAQDAQRKLEEDKERLNREGQQLKGMEGNLDLPLKTADRLHQEVSEILRICMDAQRMEEDANRDERYIHPSSASITTQTSEVEGIQSLEQARAKLRELNREKDALTTKLFEDSRAIEGMRNELDKAMASLDEARKQVLRLEKEAGDRLDLTKERKRLNDAMAALYQQVEQLQHKITPLELQVEDLESSRKTSSESAKMDLDVLRSELDACISEQRNIESARELSEEPLKGGTKERLEAVEADLVQRRHQLDSIEVDLVSAKKQREVLMDTARKVEVTRRRLTVMLSYSASVEELKKMVEEKSRLEREVQAGEEGASNLREELARLEGILRELSLKREKIAGGREAYQKQQNQIKAQMMDPSMRDVEKRHADKLMVSMTTKLAATDLERYCRALDTALMRFHAQMVEDINRRIRELWQLTYRGGDIDRVELKAEQGTGVSAHTYTYRVVMRKNHTELDMRGRCSAGQKVLASLVIRLALADTFSTKCGVLALDEPSTNLDLDNKKGLAEALVEIIKSRANQSNFQLIVITHDDEFVEIIQNQLGTSGEKFHRVSRVQDQSGRYVSRITEESGTMMT